MTEVSRPGMIIKVPVSLFENKPEYCPFGHELWRGKARVSWKPRICEPAREAARRGRAWGISTAVATTGIWNLAFKFGLPIIAVVLVAITGQSTGGAVGAALLGVLIIGVGGVVLWPVFRSPRPAPAGWAAWVTGS